jgi:hypothetical protein
MTTLTWDSLPKLRDGHPSQEGRRVPSGIGVNGIEYKWYSVPCGEWWNGGIALCEPHEKLYYEQYPQGWRSYPGDICPHGMYTGGVGVDRMCGACEMGA